MSSAQERKDALLNKDPALSALMGGKNEAETRAEATRGARAEATRGARAEATRGATDIINSIVSFHSNKK